MLEGLEISEILLSRVPFENTVLRIDSEYFLKKYLSEDVKRQKYATVYLGSEYFITDGQHGYHEVDEKSSIRHLTAKNFKNWFADDIGADRIAQWVDDNNRRSSLMENDLVMTTRGTVGFCALVKRNVLPANIDQDVARIAQLNGNRISPHFLVSYINTRFGQDWTKRNQTGMVQQGLALWRVKELPVPLLATSFQKRIEEIVEKAYSFKSSSVNFYFQAETLLRDTIIIKDFQPSNDPVNIKSFKESFLRTGRLDAEYYQKKYEEVVKHITKQNHESLANIVTIKKSIEPGSDAYSDEGLPFLRVSDYNKFEIRTPEKKLSIDFCNENEELLDMLKPTKNTILFSKDGSVGNAHLLRENADFVTSGAVLQMTIKQPQKVIPEYLTLVLNSELVQMQAERDSGGSIILHWRLEEIESVVVPIIEYSLQKEIASLIEESFRLKIESIQLLETAKRAVEIAIEEDERAAMKYIEEKVNIINTLKNDH